MQVAERVRSLHADDGPVRRMPCALARAEHAGAHHSFFSYLLATCGPTTEPEFLL
jgi:hypothetical protein